jgi:hypothetical protein
MLNANGALAKTKTETNFPNWYAFNDESMAAAKCACHGLFGVLKSARHLTANNLEA